MEDNKIKPALNGSAETMLQSFYARALYSKNPRHPFKDAKAEEIVEKLDYDFSKAKKDTAMSSGVIARTFVLDELVSDFMKKTLIVQSSISPVDWTLGFTAWITGRSHGITLICQRQYLSGTPFIMKKDVFLQSVVPA